MLEDVEAQIVDTKVELPEVVVPQVVPEAEPQAAEASPESAFSKAPSLDAYLKNIAQPTSEDEALEVFHRLHILIASWIVEKLPSVKGKLLLSQLFGPVPEKLSVVPDSTVSESKNELQEKIEEVKKAASPFLKMVSKCWTK